MKTNGIVEEVIVHPVGGMQLSEGVIRQDSTSGFMGYLPGLGSFVGETMEEVRSRLEEMAKAYYGGDVVVDFAPHCLSA